MPEQYANRALTIIQRIGGFFGRYLEVQVIKFVAITFLVLGLINLVVACLTSEGGINIYGTWAGGDYSCFYIAGTILNDYAPDKLYDFGLQSKLLHLLLPKIPINNSLPFINPPFFALIFRPLSHLPYLTSYLLWVAVTIMSYLSGLLLLRKSLKEIPNSVFNLSILLALSFEPFMMENLFGGNSSACAFLAIALAIYLERKERPLASGMAFGLCFYKPTFLVLILPMLFFTRRFKSLLGVFICLGLLSCISLLTLGSEVCLQYVQLLFNLTHKTWQTADVFRVFKYVDILSFFYLLFKENNLAVLVISSLTLLVSIILFIIACSKLNRSDQDRSDLILAGAIALTPVFNMHFAIYDTIIVVVAILLAMDVWYRNKTSSNAFPPPLFKFLLVMLYLMPWVTQYIANVMGLQIFTAVLAATGGYFLITARYGRFV